MDKQEAKNRIRKLRKAIDRHRYLYHVLDTQEISDAALDSLKKELFNLEQEYPGFITPDSPTQRVGGQPLKEFKKVRHAQRMLSLQDVFSREDFHAWHERIAKLLTEEERARIDFYCELKIDGLAIELEYEDGVLKIGSTRGDGLVGEDVTQNLKTVEAIPLRVSGDGNRKVPKHLIVRGEVFISKKEFEKINAVQREKRLPPYANPRNIAAGSVRQLDPKITAQRRLDSFAYDLVTELSPKVHEQKHKMLKALGFKTNAHNRYCKTISEVFDFYEEVGKGREKLEYEIDGVVVIVNDNTLFEKLGVIGKAPRGAVAFKFAQNQATTKVEDIKLQVGRTGAITPVALLKPVQVSGITISRATLHNQDEIRRLGLKIGDTVVVGRAGDVIPNIIGVLPELRDGSEKDFTMPAFCPACKTKLEKLEKEAVWRCPNPKCFARQRRFFYHFVSRHAFNMDGLGPKIIDKFLEEGLIQDPSDLFSLKEGDILPLERFGEKSAENLVKSINERREITLSHLVYALGIRNVGEQTAVDLAEHFGSIVKMKNASLEDFESIPNIGPVVAESIYQWFNSVRNADFLKKLEKDITINNEAERIEGGRLKGLRFVLTGTLEVMDRGSAKERIRELGGEVSESVSKKINVVVAGTDPGSKLNKVEKMGIKVIGEKEFLEMIRQ